MILIAFGSNLSFLTLPPARVVQAAQRAVSALGTVSAISALYESAAWPDPAEPRYVNAVMRLENTALLPGDLLEALHVIEAGFGRSRDMSKKSNRYAARTLDLDLLAYDDMVLEDASENGLQLPHPAIAQRDFVLLPLIEVAPDWRHPETGNTAEEMLSALKFTGSALTARLLDEPD